MMSDVLLIIDEEEAKVIERALMVASANVAMFPDIEDLINKVKEARKNGNNNVGKNVKFIPSSYSNADIARDYFADGGASLSDIYGRQIFIENLANSPVVQQGTASLEIEWRCAYCGRIYIKGDNMPPTHVCGRCGRNNFERYRAELKIRPDIWSE